MKKIFFFFLFLFFNLPYSSKSYSEESISKYQSLNEKNIINFIDEIPFIEAECFGNDIDTNNLDWLAQIQNLELNMNLGNYMSNILRKKLNVVQQKNLDIANNLKKRSWSDYKKINIKKDNSKCIYSGNYRLTGDLTDHFGGDGDIPHSIKIKLKDSNLDQITKFKLFVPITRSGKYEVLNVLIHKELGFIAPRTALIDVKIMDKKYKALFQEDITKEMLEYNNFHEALLIEGDEGYRSLDNPKIINSRFINNIYLDKIAKDILYEISNLYSMTSKLSNEVNESSTFDDPPLFIDFLPKNNKKKFVSFHLLNYALNSSNGLSRDDHRIVYDHISRFYYPIFYDGHYSANSSDEKKHLNFEFNKSDKELIIKKLKNLNKKKLLHQAKNHGANFNEEEIKDIIFKAIIKLNQASPSIEYLNLKKKFISDDKYTYLLKASQYIRSLYKIDSNFKLEYYWKVNENKIERCFELNNNLSCNLMNIDNSFFKKKLFFESQNISSGIYLHNFNEDNKVKYDFDLKKNRKIVDNDFYIEFTSNIEPIINIQNKTITFKKEISDNQNTLIKISDGIIENWQITLTQEENFGYKKVKNSRFSKYGLTGCITFNDMEIKNLKLIINNTNCEDAAHFVRSNGVVDYLEIYNSKEDALDVDFSKLRFNKIKIDNAFNDCLDFSSGEYYANEVELSNCKDKAISIGEKSRLNLNYLNVTNAMIGVVAKDDSQLKIKQASILETKICAMAYRKKQEFGGGLILYENMKCNSAPIFVQNRSRIDVIK